MSLFANKNTRVIVQGITGQQASFHSRRSVDYGTKIVGGVSPGKGGVKYLGVPVFNTMKEATKELNANASVLYVPAQFAKSAMIEAIEAEVDVAVCITDSIAVKDMLEVKAALKGSKTKLIGPNTPGIIAPKHKVRLGIFPASLVNAGSVGIVSRSSTLTYEAIIESNRAGLGQTTVVGLGDDVLIGQDFVDVLKELHDDEDTKSIVFIGQLGGMFEEEAADFYASVKNKKPVVAYVAGSTIAEGSEMGYVGDFIAGSQSVEAKKKALEKSGMIIVDRVSHIHKELLKL